MKWTYDLLLLGILLSALFFFGLGYRPLSNPDEARYSEIPREMLLSGDFITPHLNGIKYFEKPPLLYWIQAGSFKLGGLNEWAARIPTACFAILGCLLTYALGRFLYGRKTGIYACCILATSLLYFVMGHVLTLDMTLTFLLSACLTCLLLTLNQPKPLYCYGIYFFCALAVLTKGIIGILFPVSILFFWLAILNRWAYLKELRIPFGLLLFLILVLPWHVAIQLKNPEFFRFYILDQQFLRFFTLYAGRYQPAWFFLIVLFAGFFPWTIYLFQIGYTTLCALVKNKFEHKNELFLLLWFLIIFLFFSFSKSKLIPYILPVFPPLSILIARYLTSHRNHLWDRFFLIGLTALLLFTLYIASKKYLFPLVASHYTLVFSLILIVGALGNVFLKKYYFWGLMAWALAFNLCLIAASPYIEIASIKPLLNQLRSCLHPEDLVVSYGYYYQDMPFYLNRFVTVVNVKNELSFGMEHQNTDSRVMEEKQFWAVW